MQEILKGTLGWKYPCKVVNKWIANLKRAYDEDSLRDKASKIGGLIDTNSFKKYFTKKKESMESSPSQRYMGHYKAIVNNKALVQLHT